MYHLCHYVFSFTVENFFFWRKFTTYIYTSHVNICSMFPKLSRKFTTYIYTSHVTMFFRSRFENFFFGRGHNIYTPPMSLCFFVHDWKLFFGRGHNIYTPPMSLYVWCSQNFLGSSQHIYTPPMSLCFFVHGWKLFFLRKFTTYIYHLCHYVPKNFFKTKPVKFFHCSQGVTIYVRCSQNFLGSSQHICTTYVTMFPKTFSKLNQ